jgi:hypothetical protein
MFTTKKPPTLEDLETAVNTQTEVLRRVLSVQAMQGEMLSAILAAVTQQPAQEENDLETVLRALFAVNSEHAARLAEVVTLLKTERQ